MINRLAPGCADALLFDLGRVVIDIDIQQTLDCWAGYANCEPADIRARFVLDEAYLQYERGKIGDAAFFAALRDTLGLALSDEQFLEGWNAIFRGEMPGVADLLTRASRHVPLYALSNTNRAHVAHFSKHFAEVLRPFKTIFLSSIIGLRKPDTAVYDHVVREIGVPASRIVFFDDLMENIEGAETRGLIGVHVKTTADIADALAALGI